MIGRNIIVVGASAGGVEAVSRLLGQMPADLNAAILIVVHIGASPSRLPEVLGRVSRLPVKRPIDGEEILAGHVYVAPADRHMLVEAGRIRLVHGPKENFTRPAIDPLFRSAAMCFGPRVVGIVLTGRLDDGSAGLIAIKDQGGIAIVQEPGEALASSMPESAIACTAVDHICRIDEMVRLLKEYDPPQMRVPPVPGPMKIEHKMAVMDAFLSNEEALGRLGLPSTLTCPDCHGVLYQLRDERLLRFRCRAGHAMTARNLLDRIASERENALWSVIRALTEEAWLSRRLHDGGPGRADQLLAHADMLRTILDDGGIASATKPGSASAK